MLQEIKFADLFAGGGGTTNGAISVPSINVVWALNHDKKAIETHAANHPETKHFKADIRTQSLDELDPVDILWASLECTEHSKAKGGKEKNTGSFMLGWELLRYIVHCDPKAVIIENVTEFVRWGELKKGKRVKEKEGTEFRKWVKAIERLGYRFSYKNLNAADYGDPTKRVRFIGIFMKREFPICWPEQTHSEEEGMFGMKKWIACRSYIDIENEGHSIFGREFNEQLPKQHRRPLVDNTLRRIAGGLKKFAPEIYYIMKYYGNGDNCQSISSPLHTIRTRESHALIKVEKLQFIQDYCFNVKYDKLDVPLRTQMTKETKQLITLEKQFLTKYYNDKRPNGKFQVHGACIDNPFPTIKTKDGNALISAKAHFLNDYYGRDNTAHSIEKPTATITTANSKHLVTVKANFVSPQYNSNGKPESNNQGIDQPLKTITTREKFQFITAFCSPEIGQNIETDIVDFDIKMRFLSDDELGSIMGFPEGYFKKLGTSKQKNIEMIGNAVPKNLAKAVIQAVTDNIVNNSIKQAC